MNLKLAKGRKKGGIQKNNLYLSNSYKLHK